MAGSGADDVRLLTWNVHGSAGLDVPAVADVLHAAAPDVITLQEVQQRQADALAAALGMTVRWAFKHWPVIQPPEGVAILSPHALHDTRAWTLRAAPPWDWRRRVVLSAEVRRPGLRVGVLDVHLSPHGAVGQRAREAGRVLDAARRGPPLVLIGGDLNEVPGGTALAAFEAAGWTDAWAAVRGDELGATSWHAGSPARDLPDRRIDYVLAPPGATVLDCAIPLEVAVPMTLSDHLPVVATITL